VNSHHKPSRDRDALYLVSTLLLGIVIFAALEWFVVFHLGQDECDDRADCSWIGDLTYGPSVSIAFGASLLVAAVLVWGVVRLTRRIRG
jgi:hypothetical protein